MKTTVLIGLCLIAGLPGLAFEIPDWNLSVSEGRITGYGFEETYDAEGSRISGEWRFETVFSGGFINPSLHVHYKPISLLSRDAQDEFYKHNAEAYFDGEKWYWLVNHTTQPNGVSISVKRADITLEKPSYLGGKNDVFLYGLVAFPWVAPLLDEYSIIQVQAGDIPPHVNSSVSESSDSLSIETWDACTHVKVVARRGAMGMDIRHIEMVHNLCGDLPKIVVDLIFDDYISGSSGFRYPSRITRKFGINGVISKVANIVITNVSLGVDEETQFTPRFDGENWTIRDHVNGLTLRPDASAAHQIETLKK